MSARTDQRAKQILLAVLKSGTTSVDQLVQLTGASPASVRRDLTRLEQRGLLRRTHGGAEVARQGQYEPFRFDSSFQERESRFSEEKRQIGMAAAELVGERETVGMTAGTTTTQVARCMRHRTGIHVITNAMNIGIELSSQPGMNVTLVGGTLRWADAYSLTGPMALEAIGGFFMDIAFIGACGIDPVHGATTIEAEEAAVFRAFVRQARQVVLVADSSKIGMLSPSLICPLNQIHKIVTDRDVDQHALEAFRAAGVEVVIV